MSAVAMQEPPEGVAPEMLAAMRGLPGSGNRKLDAYRQACVDTFGRSGIPTMRHEDWKYTDLPRVLTPWWSRLCTPAAGDALFDAGVLDALRLNDLDAQRLVFVDGHFHPGLSDAPLAGGDGLYAGPLAPLLDMPPSWLILDAGESEAPLYHGLNAANGALFTDGLAVHVPAGKALPRPVQAIFLSRSGQVSHPRNHVDLAAGARATVIEQYASIQAPDREEGALDNAVSRIALAEGAELTHYRLQQLGPHDVHLGRVQVDQEGGRYAAHAVNLGGQLCRLDIVAGLQREGAGCELNGLYMAGGLQHTDCHTRIDHHAPACSSREFFKGVLDGRAHAVFNGKIVVYPDAQKTDSAQSNANLVLSRQAEIDTKPELEIYADDVKCAHGATVGQLDANQLFYLRSRGFSEAAAKQTLTVAFADEVLARMPHPEVRAYLERVGLSRLAAAAEVLA
ncbi:MAG TPA: Fe-S cluster assembly protein SufD [Mariprofundaceae bacterium]|nr:Fe-S cluster assembly protein SufD [Mariprofundaceae bacterium]